MEEPQQRHFLLLPPEIRDEIYRLILHPDANRKYHEYDHTSYNYAPALGLFRVNKQIAHESRKIFHDLNVFVRIGTPWPEAQHHVANEGEVPILISEPEHVAKFSYHRMVMSVDAPEHPMLQSDAQRFIILLDDLEKFAKMWFYADLSHPGLNEHLRLTLQLQDPFALENEENHISKALQRKLLLPFGHVKNLKETVITGDPKPYSSLETEVRALQAKPHLSPEHCLKECVRLKLEGNTELNAGRYESALELYKQAWAAIHIVIKGRRRHIHADAFFARDLREEPYRGKNGQTERLVLRVQLVANTCLAYLKLGQEDECLFWGMRTIDIWRDGMGVDTRHDIPPQDEAILGFPAADQMGKIYYRTALAYKELGENIEARKLLQVARIYLPNDKSVKAEAEALIPRIG